MSFAAAIASRVAQRGSQHARQLSTLTLPDLPYDYNALEPVISAEIMELHHKKHHQTYVNTFNTLAEQLSDAEGKSDVAKMIALQGGIKFNGGGHVNHSIFWKNLTPPKDFEPPSGELAKAIEAEFGSVDNLISKFNPRTAAVQGSGWGWLGYSAETGRLQIATTGNQDPLVTQGLTPLLGIDVWEHAYYLQYKNVRPDYLKNIWKVVNWKDVGQRYEAAKST
jgi:Fe-Mn family superoxide dismutase